MDVALDKFVSQCVIVLFSNAPMLYLFVQSTCFVLSFLCGPFVRSLVLVCNLFQDKEKLQNDQLNVDLLLRLSAPEQNNTKTIPWKRSFEIKMKAFENARALPVQTFSACARGIRSESFLHKWFLWQFLWRVTSQIVFMSINTKLTNRFATNLQQRTYNTSHSKLVNSKTGEGRQVLWTMKRRFKTKCRRTSRAVLNNCLIHLE